MRSSSRWAVPLVAGLLALGAVPADLLGGAQAAPRVPVRDDFNGDGYADLAVGAPGATVGGQSKAGYVAVTYGGPHGVSSSRRAVISRATGGIPGSPVKGQGFGTQIAKGDLNGDGYADLVVGVATRTGDAVVVWGGPRGLSGGGVSIPASRALTGDFDGDGRLDLALFRTGDSPGDDPLGTTATVWTGPVGRSGTPARTSALDPGRLQYVDVKDGATGDVNGDGRDELALGVYCGEGSYCTDFYTGSASGLKYRRDTIPSGDGGVALGDLNGDGHDDVAVGSATDSTVTVAYGSASGVRPRGTWKSYTQDTPGVPGANETNDRFGTALSAGDITGDGIDDLAVGVPGKELGYDDGAGAVVVLRGSRTGLTGRSAQAFTQDTAGIPGTAEPGDAFGAQVALLDINRNGYADLAAAALGEDGGNGAVWVLRGRPTGIVTDAATVIGPKAIGAPYAKAEFGRELG
ncbi:FG-GAP-like repeat-containing protein [Streptomyces sp. NPDC002888]|uniref:FG-GAP-like repeat-containing protein n=1 Tax=Streptomyces sp. NPDC002888 TaxID=3364668 RepID=UPI003676890D